MNKLNHIAFIMDGNGRWGKKKNKGRNFGHLKGVETVKKIVKSCISSKIPILTFFVFSSENWKRPKTEIAFLFKLIKNYFFKEIDKVIDQGIKINILGDITKLPSDLKKILIKSVKLTKKNKMITVNLAINYGSRNEILNANKIILKKKMRITYKNFEKSLYNKKIPEPDLLIRTGGENRLSNFLLWQLAYSELYFIKKLWPDFKVSDYNKIIKHFRKVKRNFGNI